jgi:hypothetical protein
MRFPGVAPPGLGGGYAGKPRLPDRRRSDTITVIRDALREEAASVLREYAESGGEIYTTPARAAPRD